MDSNEIGKRVKQRRKELNITQTQIQQVTNISPGNLSNIENGKYLPSTPALIELSKALQCSIDWILTGKIFSDFEKTTNQENEILKKYEMLSQSNKESANAMIDGLLKMQKEREKSSHFTAENKQNNHTA